MAASNKGFGHMPRIVSYGGSSKRQPVRLTARDSAAIYLGGFVPMIEGTEAAPAGAEFGIPAFSDDDRIYGFVIGFSRNGKALPIQDDPDKAGTVTDATGEVPMKYTFSATNDESNTTSADLEQAIVMPVMPGDILEIALWGGAAVSVARATTTAAGTTNSSANMGVGISVDTTYHFALTESTAAKALADLDFLTTKFNNRQPSNPNHVYVRCVRKDTTVVVAQ
ncbi:MAG: hypothetical protein ACE5DX_05460 [Candidatus Dojkabacteria bacterium]